MSDTILEQAAERGSGLVYLNIFNLILTVICMFICSKYNCTLIKKLWPGKRASGLSFGFPLFLWHMYKMIFVHILKRKTQQREQKFKSQMMKLFPLENFEETETRCYAVKIRRFLCLWIAVNAAAAAAALSMYYGNEVFKSGELLRPEPGGEESFVDMELGNQTLGKQKIKVKVSPRIYEGEEREALFSRAENYVRSHALGDNRDWNEVRKRLNLMTSIPDTGITAEWTIDDYHFLDDSGNIVKETVSEAGEDTSVTVSMKYAGDIRQFKINMTIYPPLMSEKEKFLEAAAEALEKCDKESLTEEAMTLPSEINGERIIWSEQEDNISVKITAAGIFILIAGTVSKAGETKERLRKRSEQLLLDYPEFVYKLVLLNGAGMELKPSLALMVKEAETGNRLERYVWQEAKVALKSMEQGVSEVQAYEMFGQRCGELPYLKLSTLMIQSLKKGSGGMSRMMADTADEAVMMKREQARKAGEVIETKLLVPMGMMLLIVLVILVVPAFMTMNV